MRALRVGLAQINTTVGDLDGNVSRVLEYVERARELGVDVGPFPELTVTGYPPEDLLLRPSFVRDNLEALEAVVKGCGGITAVVGFVGLDGDIYNSAAVIHDGRLADVYHKQRLPNYGVFDEMRYFSPGQGCPVYTIAGAGGGGGHRQHQRLALPHGQARVPPADAGHARRRLRRLRLLHEPGRRPG